MIRLLSAIAAVAILAIGGFMFLGPRDRGALPENPMVGAADAQSDKVDTSGVVEMTLGDPAAPVTVIEYASFTCSHCADFHEGSYKKLKAEYIDTGKVHFIYRDVYFDKFGLWAAMVARCEPAKFFGVSDLIYKSQSDWTRAGEPAAIVAELRKIGRLAGLSDERLDACMQDAANAETLVAWYQDNATRDGVEGTPSFIINGEKVANQAWDSFKAIIDAELAK
jgi:protein-disulfide isomerase